MHDTEESQRSFPMSGAGPWKLSIDNLTGSIRVAASDQQSVELAVTKVIAARDPEYLDMARKEVTLYVTDTPGSVDLYVDGPFRCNCNDRCTGSVTARGSCRGDCNNGGCWSEQRRNRDFDHNYRVRYDF